MNRCFVLVFLVVTLFLHVTVSYGESDSEQCIKKMRDKDYGYAYVFCLKAAEQGNSTSQLSLGILYQSGDVVNQDFKEALKWYRLSADQGDSLAQFLLGAMYSEGNGVTQNYMEALKWYRMSADQGNSTAQYYYSGN